MFSKVLVGVDGRQGGRDAAALATQLMARGGTLTLAHIYRDEGGPRVRGYDDHEAAEIGRSRALLQAANDVPGIDVHLRWSASDSAGRGLHQMAEGMHADLVVVGSTRRGTIGRILIGDDTRATLNDAPCAVAVAPADYANRAAAIGKIGVGYDGSPESERALSTARALAKQLDATLAVMAVAWFPADLLGRPGADDDTSTQDLIEDAYDRVASLGDVEPHAAFGEPAEALAAWSESLDVLVLGSRGGGTLTRLVQGSTSQELARNARCPLVVVTPADRKAAAAGSEVRPDTVPMVG